MAIPTYDKLMESYRQQRPQDMIGMLSTLSDESLSTDSVGKSYELMREKLKNQIENIAKDNVALEKKLTLDEIVYKIKEGSRRRSAGNDQNRQMLLKQIESYVPANMTTELSELTAQTASQKQFEIAVDTLYVGALFNLGDQHKGPMGDYFSLVAALLLTSIILREKEVGVSSKIISVIHELVEESPNYDLIKTLQDELSRATIPQIERRLKEEEARFANKADWEIDDDLALIQLMVRSNLFLENIGYGVNMLPAEYTINYDLISKE